MTKTFCICLLMICAGTTHAGTIAVPHTFESNTPALASEVNANFQALVDAINAQQATINQLQTDLNAAENTIAQLQTDLAAAEAQIDGNSTAIAGVQANSVLTLDGFLFLDTDANGFDTARFDAINVQVTNGLGATNGAPGIDAALSGPVNGLGNLVIGYNESHPAAVEACSNGAFANQTDCENNSGIWAANQKTGSHSLVIGVGHSYTRHGHLLAGFGNTANRRWAGVSGGATNVARGIDSSVSGGLLNIASGTQSSVSGGRENTASSPRSSVSGGRENVAGGVQSTISGGRLNDATGENSSVGGGLGNDATGDNGYVGGGQLNVASGISSAVSGGLENEATGNNSTVGGGRERSVTGLYDWRAGTPFEEQ